ncbi:MAG TPA: ABC transporter ATP-binding protein, partial [Terriglobia bacterium]|nr:ABC transporter ATP-binding protein [Terriglobia bacterium]
MPTAEQPKRQGLQAWKERLQALRNIPPLIRLMWKAGPGTVVLGAASRVIAGVVPIATLDVSRLIIKYVVALYQKHPLPRHFWWLVVLEFACAAIGSLFGRIIDYSDTVLADRYTLYISVRVMKHASHLDLVRYEDPDFYDKLERARVQATDRLATIRMMGQLLQQ